MKLGRCKPKEVATININIPTLSLDFLGDKVATFLNPIRRKNKNKK
jgi:hypothetical protein